MEEGIRHRRVQSRRSRTGGHIRRYRRQSLGGRREYSLVVQTLPALGANVARQRVDVYVARRGKNNTGHNPSVIYSTEHVAAHVDPPRRRAATEEGEGGG